MSGHWNDLTLVEVLTDLGNDFDIGLLKNSRRGDFELGIVLSECGCYNFGYNLRFLIKSTFYDLMKVSCSSCRNKMHIAVHEGKDLLASSVHLDDEWWSHRWLEKLLGSGSSLPVLGKATVSVLRGSEGLMAEWVKGLLDVDAEVNVDFE